MDSETIDGTDIDFSHLAAFSTKRFTITKDLIILPLHWNGFGFLIGVIITYKLLPQTREIVMVYLFQSSTLAPSCSIHRSATRQSIASSNEIKAQ